MSIHVFCDASEKAYGAALYVVTSEGSRLLMSKARVAPLKTGTIPQLELTALLVGCRLLHYALSVFKVKSVDSHVWTDHFPCLGWVANDHSKIVYVRNRVAEIRELMQNHKFTLHHVATKENPAGLLSRGMSYKDMAASTQGRHLGGAGGGGGQLYPSSLKLPSRQASTCTPHPPSPKEVTAAGFPLFLPKFKCVITLTLHLVIYCMFFFCFFFFVTKTGP